MPDFQFTGTTSNFDPLNAGDIFSPENQLLLDQLLPRQLSTHFARNNLSAFYENEIWQARISLNHRSDCVRTTIGLQGLTQIVDDYTQVDASLSYGPIDRLVSFLEGINLTGEGYFEYSEISEALVTYEDNEARITFGLRASF